jgi:hypothetical protein
MFLQFRSLREIENGLFEKMGKIVAKGAYLFER